MSHECEKNDKVRNKMTNKIKTNLINQSFNFVILIQKIIYKSIIVFKQKFFPSRVMIKHTHLSHFEIP